MPFADLLALPAGLAAGAMGEVVVAELDRDEARDAAADELSRPEYDAARPPLLLRLLGRVLRELGDLLGSAAGEVPGGRAGVALLALLLTGTVALVLVRLRPSVRSAREAGLFGSQQQRTAAEHRAAAEAAAAAGRYDEAVRERLRALVRELEARGVLDARPGRTAGEVARDGGSALPELATDLRRATTAFDEVWYGGRTADAATYAVVVEVDTRIRAARLAVT